MRINCIPCRKDLHDQCTHDNCLCEIETEHNTKREIEFSDIVNSIYPPVKEKFPIFDELIDQEIFNEIIAVDNAISREPKSYSNDDFWKVAIVICEDIYFLTIRETGEIYWYDKIEKLYKPLGHTIIAELCQKLIRKCTKHTVSEVIDTIRRSGTMIYLKEILESKIINAQDGILDPKTFEVNYHSPEYYTTKKLPFSFEPKKINLKLWNHILTIIDPKDINRLMELIWVNISWNNPFKKLFIFKGLTNTQKTTLADILVWIVGNENVSREKPSKFLGQNNFSTSKFIGKRMNIATEIGTLTKDEFENLKSLVGAEKQNTERKYDNAEYIFDPTKFVFLFTTNYLGKLYSSIEDDATINRLEFLTLRNQIKETDGLWEETFFENQQDRQSAIDTIVKIVKNYKKAQSLGKIPKTKWSSIEETKRILREEMPIEDKYFADGRIIKRDGSRLTLDEIQQDFESFVGYKVKNSLEMGYILKKNGIESSKSNGKTIFKGYSFSTAKDQSILQ